MSLTLELPCEKYRYHENKQVNDILNEYFKTYSIKDYIDIVWLYLLSEGNYSFKESVNYIRELQEELNKQKQETMNKQTINFNGATIIVDECYEVKQEGTKFSIVKKDDTIYVPDCIHLDFNSDIMFNEDKQGLYVDKVSNVYIVSSICKSLAKYKHRLVPCKRENLKCGDTAFRTDLKFVKEIDDLSNYCKILNKREYVYVYDKCNIAVSDCSYLYWYKVVKA